MFHFEERDTGKERNEDEGHYPENDDRRHSEPLDSRPASPSHVQRHRQGHGTLPSIGRSASMGHDLSISRSGRRSSPQPYTVITRQKASESARHPVSGLRRDNTYPGRSVPRPSSSGSAIRSRSSPQSLSISEPWNEEVHSLHDQEIVRAITGIPPGVALSLSSADSPSSGLKETKKYKQLVILAIWESASRRLTLQEIYDAMTQRFPLFASMNEHKAPWKQSIRHMLSLYKIFVPHKRPVTVPGKGGWWGLDLTQPVNALKRSRKRNPGKGKIADDDEDAGELSDTESEPRKAEENEGLASSSSFPSTPIPNEWTAKAEASSPSPLEHEWPRSMSWHTYPHVASYQQQMSYVGTPETQPQFPYNVSGPQSELFRALPYGQDMSVYGQPHLPPLASSQYSPLPASSRIRRGAVSAASSQPTFSVDVTDEAHVVWTPASQENLAGENYWAGSERQ